MAFGITGTYIEGGKATEFSAPYDKRLLKISSLPNRSIRVIAIYNHGAPGEIGDDDVESLTRMLGGKVMVNGQIHLLGCSTAGVTGGGWYNPVRGWGLLLRAIMYHGSQRMMGQDEVAVQWARNLAGDLSRRIPDVYVVGLSGISFPLSRVMTYIPWPDDLEGYTPTGLIADRLVYYNGALASLP